jgi:hypothetical protein
VRAVEVISDVGPWGEASEEAENKLKAAEEDAANKLAAEQAAAAEKLAEAAAAAVGPPTYLLLEHSTSTRLDPLYFEKLGASVCGYWIPRLAGRAQRPFSGP